MYIAAVRTLEWVKKCKQLIGINLECPPVRMPPAQTWNDSVLTNQNIMCVLLQKCRENRRNMIQDTKLRMPLNPNAMDFIGVILQISVVKPDEKPSPISPYMAGKKNP